MDSDGEARSDQYVFLDGVCTFCGIAVPSPERAEHTRTHMDEVRDYTLRIIRDLHPEWVEEDGSCARCESWYDEL